MHVNRGVTYLCTQFLNREVSVTLTSVRRIGAHAFEDCSALELLSLPESLEVLGAEAFRGCARLLQVLRLGESTEVMGDGRREHLGLLKRS